MPVQLILRNPLDRDAREYIQRAGVTDAAARLQLNEFVRGVKQLGLWDSMVCWPLRSTQNAGTGTTIHSLGGLGSYDGSLVNGPVWGTDGISLDSASSQQIEWTTSPLSDFTNGHSMLGVFKPTGPTPASSTITRQISILQGGQTVMEFGQGGTGSTTSGLAQYRLTRGRETSAFTTYALHKDVYCFYEYDPQPSVRVFSTGGSVGTGALAAQPFNYDASLSMFLDCSADGANTAAFWAIFSAGTNILSASEALRTLYKSTLGTGLGLP